MTTLTITRGLPASGKTFWARQQPGWRVNRDDLRAMVVSDWPHGDAGHEDLLTGVQRNLIIVLLARDRDVTVDDTNLRPDVVDRLRRIAAGYGAEFLIEDFTHVPLDVCLERDAARPNPVGEQVIRGMWERYLKPAEPERHPFEDLVLHEEDKALLYQGEPDQLDRDSAALLAAGCEPV